MLPRKIFENSRTVMAILVHFEQFSGKLGLIEFFAPNFECYTGIDT